MSRLAGSDGNTLGGPASQLKARSGGGRRTQESRRPWTTPRTAPLLASVRGPWTPGSPGPRGQDLQRTVHRPARCPVRAWRLGTGCNEPWCRMFAVLRNGNATRPHTRDRHRARDGERAGVRVNMLFSLHVRVSSR